MTFHLSDRVDGSLQTDQGDFNLVSVQKVNKNRCIYRYLCAVAAALL